EDFESLHLVSPTKIARETDYIARDIAFIDRLTERGYTYETNDGVYFDTAKFPAYRDFARLDLDHLRAGARVSFSSEKRNVSDFALWKFIQPGEDHAMRWDYLGRPGYPGWHIECSVISHEELGEPLDIHTGGIDHIPVHHTNEIAQSEAAYDLELAKFWLHCNFITIDGQKISKSLGNTYTLDDLAEKGFTPLDFKMWVLQGHYQGERNFSFEDLMAAKNRLLGWRNRIALLYQGVGAETSGGIEEILKALNDNLNSAKAFALIDNTALTMDEWRKLDEIFGLELINSTPDITEEQRGLMLKREVARKEKDYTTADKIRAELERGGVTVLDSADGSVWQYL
ncbi:cysteine--tRNA ligase, partial [Candidatus Saccharibacteria bacterium]|nr:cysteine--tRNA ligase [Candidatus Saccharibacteria bacterium]